jgi:hypothetical protein
MRLTNTTRETLPAIPVKGEAKDGQAPTESLLPGETRNLNVDPENPTVRGYLFAGALVEERESRKAVPKE